MDTSSPTTALRRRLARVRAMASLGILSFLLMSAGSVAAAATASNDWTQAQGSAQHAGVVADAPAPPYVEAWTAPVPPGGPNQQFGLSAPVIAGDTVIAVGPEQVVGFHLQDGAPAFTVHRTLGPSVPPALATLDGGTAVAFTEGFGTEPPSTFPTSPSPSTATPSVSSPSPSTSASPGAGASSGGSTPPAIAELPTESRLAAFDLETQKPLWPPIALDQVSRTGVTVDGETAYVGDDLGTVYAIDLARGTIKWRGAVGQPLGAPVSVGGDLVIVTVPGSLQDAPAIVALKTADGTKAWTYGGDGPGADISGAAVSSDAVYAAFGDNTVRALDLQSGTLRWSGRLNAVDQRTGSPAVTDDAVYTLDLIGHLSRFSPATGERVWDFAINERVFRSPAVAAGDHVLAATGHGRLVAIDPVSGHLVWESGTTGVPLRALTPTADLIVAVRGGSAAGLVAYRHDDNGALVDVVSPTVFNTSTFARNLGLAVLPFLVVTVLIGRSLSARMGPAFIVEDDGGPEPVDPWATDDGNPA